MRDGFSAGESNEVAIELRSESVDGMTRRVPTPVLGLPLKPALVGTIVGAGWLAARATAG